MTKALDLTGQRFGRLVAQERAGLNQHRASVWRCLCDCGATTLVPLGQLRDGVRRHCGCGRPRKAPAPPRRQGGRLYGYTWTAETVTIIDEAAAACIRLIDALDREWQTQHAIARALDAGHPRADGRPWRQPQIWSILTNRHLYRGGRQGKSREHWPAILEA